MADRQQSPIALTIAGSDSGGGAGIQADLKTFAALEVHGTTAITCLTAQNPRQIIGIQAAQTELVRQQMGAILRELKPDAIKTGMLYSSAIIRAVVQQLPRKQGIPLIVDPVMVSTSGSRLLRASAIRILRTELLPRADLVTPNLDEAEILTGLHLREPENLRTAARAIVKQWGCAALIKGGHLPNCREALDIFFDGKTELMLTAAFVQGVSTHGTGCTYSAAITAYCARGYPLVEAVQRAKEFITQAIAHSYRARGHGVLNHFPGRMPSRPRTKGIA